MKNVSYLICAAGEGSRMRDISPTISKTLLQLQGKTLLERSLESLPLQPGDEIIFLHRLDEKDFSQAARVLEKITVTTKTSVKPLRLERLTSGQAETAYLAKNVIHYPRIAIYNTDTYFKSENLKLALTQHDFDGIAPCYRAQGEQWSFFKTEGGGPFYRSTEVQEKKRISDWCSTGLYYFKDADLFFAEVDSILKRGSQKQELYVAPLYTKWITTGKDIRVVDCEDFKPMGTPDQVATYWNVSPQEFQRQNS